MRDNLGHSYAPHIEMFKQTKYCSLISSSLSRSRDNKPFMIEERRKGGEVWEGGRNEEGERGNSKMKAVNKTACKMISMQEMCIMSYHRF